MFGKLKYNMCKLTHVGL